MKHQTLNRRQLLKHSLAGASGVAVGASVLTPVSASDDFVVKAEAMPDQKLHQISKRAYTNIALDPEPSAENQGFFSNPAFVVTEKGVVVFDTGGSVQIGEMVLRQIQRVTDKKVVKVFNSHWHGDHWMGNQAFVAHNPAVDIYAHETMQEPLKEGTGAFWMGLIARSTNGANEGTVLTPPNIFLKGGEVFDMGDMQLTVRHYNQMHTVADIALDCQSADERVVFVGDMVMDDRVAFMGDGSFQGTVDGIKQLLADTPGAIYAPGHGHYSTAELDIMGNYVEFCEALLSLVKHYYDEEGLSDFEMKPLIMQHEKMAKFKHWRGFDVAMGSYINVAYMEVEAASW